MAAIIYVVQWQHFSNDNLGEFTWIVVIKKFSVKYYYNHFLATTFDFASFHAGFLGPHKIFAASLFL